MKKLMPLILSTLICFNVCSQPDTSSIPKMQSTDYSSLLKKSKSQNTAAWLLLAGGTAMIITGGVIWANEVDKKSENDPLAALYTTKGSLITAIGFVAALGSIPLFIASGKNRRKAAAMSGSLRLNDASILQGYTLRRINYPALSLTISLD